MMPNVELLYCAGRGKVGFSKVCAYLKTGGDTLDEEVLHFKITRCNLRTKDNYWLKKAGSCENLAKRRTSHCGLS